MRQPQSSELRRLLNYRGSMTRLLKRRHDSMVIQLLKHQLDMPTHRECMQLGLPTKQRALIREIIMLCDDKPYLFARLIMPTKLLKGSYRRLYRLGTTPIGKLLFRDPSVTRSPFQLTQFQSDDTILKPLSLAPSQCWGRESRFHLPYGDILMTEIYLPEMEKQLC